MYQFTVTLAVVLCVSNDKVIEASAIGQSSEAIVEDSPAVVNQLPLARRINIFLIVRPESEPDDVSKNVT
ncbi:MAG: hypothetical protein ABFC94_18340 [Syntrophomonas sp.]